MSKRQFDNEWLNVETELNPFNLRVAQMLKKLGDVSQDNSLAQNQQQSTGSKKDQKKNEKQQKGSKNDKSKQGDQQKDGETEAPEQINVEKVYGKDIYSNIIRPFLEDKKLLPKLTAEQLKQQGAQEKEDPKKGKKDAKGKAQKPLTAFELQIQKTNNQKVKEELEKVNTMIINQISQDNFDFGKLKNFIKQNQAIELMIVPFFYYPNVIQKLLDRKNRNKEEFLDQKRQTYFEIIVALQNIKSKYTDYKGTNYFNSDEIIEISPQVLSDIEHLIQSVKQVSDYKQKVLAQYYPRLIYSTNYDKYFQKFDLKPYQSQIDLVNCVKECLFQLDTHNLIFFKTFVGTGKTFLSVALGNMAQTNRQSPNKLFPYTQVLYVCELKYVAIQVAQLAYNLKIPFGYLKKRFLNQKYEVVNSWQFKNEEYPAFIVADNLESASQFLQADSFKGIDKKNLILFIDEPTIDAHREDGQTTQLLIEQIKTFPRITILSSATLPDNDQMVQFISYYQNTFPNSQIHQINTTDITLGHNIKTFQNNLIYPHNLIESNLELFNRILKIQQNIFQQKSYNVQTYMNLCEQVKGFNKIDYEDIEQFKDLSQQNSQSHCIELLNQVEKKLDSEQIKQFCSIYMKDGHIQQVTEEESKSNTNEQSKKEFFTNKTILKEDAYKFLGGCMIVVRDPYEYVESNFFQQDIHLFEIDDILEKEKQIAQELQDEIELIEKKEKNKDVQSQMIQELKETKSKNFQIPKEANINTRKHFQKYHKNDKEINASQLQFKKAIPFISEKLRVSKQLQSLLQCGVGIYSTQSKYEEVLSPEYQNKVLTLAQDGHLAFLVTDQSLIFGLNFPINNIIIHDNLDLTYYQLQQLIGRVGRVGQSWVGNIYLEQNLAKELISFYHHDIQNNKELNNIENCIKKNFGDQTLVENQDIKKVSIVYNKNAVQAQYATFLLVLYHYNEMIKNYFKNQAISSVTFQKYILLQDLDTNQSADELSFDERILKLKAQSIYLVQPTVEFVDKQADTIKQLAQSNTFHVFTNDAAVSEKLNALQAASIKIYSQSDKQYIDLVPGHLGQNLDQILDLHAKLPQDAQKVYYSQFQHDKFNKAEFKKLLESVKTWSQDKQSQNEVMHEMVCFGAILQPIQQKFRQTLQYWGILANLKLEFLRENGKRIATYQNRQDLY